MMIKAKSLLAAWMFALAILFTTGCGDSSGDQPAGDSDEPASDAGNPTAVVEDEAESTDEPSEPVAKPTAPEWDYAGWGWLTYRDGLFKLATPPGSKVALSFGGQPEPITNGKDDPLPAKTIYQIEGPNGMRALATVSSQDVDTSNDIATKMFSRQFEGGMQGQLSVRETKSKKPIGYIGDYAEQFLFENKHSMMNLGSSGDFLTTVRVIVTESNQIAVTIESSRGAYDEKLIDQWLDSIELAQ